LFSAFKALTLAQPGPVLNPSSVGRGQEAMHCLTGEIPPAALRALRMAFLIRNTRATACAVARMGSTVMEGEGADS
jgi:hypothetical protein